MGPRSKRRLRQKSSTRYDYLPAYKLRQWDRQYPGVMSTRDDTYGTPQQRAFGQWVSEMLQYLDDVKGMSLREVARVSGVSHTQIYRWMGQPKSKGYSDPKPEKLKQFCQRLKLDYNEAAEKLGWVKPAPKAPPPKDLPGFIDRARRLAAHPGTSERRRLELESQIRTAESMQQAARDVERTAESLLREALGESEDADT